MQYFGSHSAGVGKVKVGNSSDLLKAQKLQIIRNANSNSPKSSVTTSIHSVRPTEIAQYNAVTQQIQYSVKHLGNVGY
uniref:Uncharacterized protein n=1 Tax=viral metagenome TaxID=1070528 RepID=A0A6C0HLD1_9ZZZZ